MLVDYGSSDDDSGPSAISKPTAPFTSKIIAAPDVSLDVSYDPPAFYYHQLIGKYATSQDDGNEEARFLCLLEEQ